MIKYLLLFCILNFSQAYASAVLKCNVDEFKIPGVDISIEESPKIKKSAVSFLIKDNYWNIATYELDKRENIYLLNGIEGLKKYDLIANKILNNYMSRLNKEMFLPNRLLETNFKESYGNEFVIEANFEKLHEDSNINQDLFVIRVLMKDNKIFFTELHVNGKEARPITIRVKEVLNKFSDTCNVIYT